MLSIYSRVAAQLFIEHSFTIIAVLQVKVPFVSHLPIALKIEATVAIHRKEPSMLAIIQ